MIHLITQTALGQGHVQHHPVGAVLLHRRQRGAQAVQLVQIDRKADGPGPGGELLHQQVVAAALEQGAGQGFQVALKHKAVVVFHLTGQRHVQPDDAARLFQRHSQRFQLSHSRAHGVIAAQGSGLCKGIGIAAAEAQHAAQDVGGGIGKTGGSGGGPQLVGVFLPQLFQQLCAGGIRHAQRVEQAEQVAHMAHFQHPLGPQRIQRPRRQTHRLLHLCFAHRTQHLKAHLADLFKGVALGGRAVDILVIVVAQGLAGGGLRRLGNGEGHVRLEGQQTAIQIGKGDDLLGRQKAAVLLIQAVLLKPAHMILAAARRFVQGAQRKGGALLGLQVCKAEFHCRFPHFLLEFILLYLGKVVK